MLKIEKRETYKILLISCKLKKEDCPDHVNIM